MSNQQRQQFDLARFVTDFLEQKGSIVTPPDFGVYEALMPDELAASLGVEPYLRFTFDGAAEDAIHLTVNHPLVDAIVEKMVEETANARGYLNQVRLGKRGIAEMAPDAFTVVNARIQPGKKSDITAKHHYLRFNFKITYESDEKEEEIRSVVMDVQGGYAVQEPDLLQALESYEETSIFRSKLVAQPRWLKAETPFAAEVFRGLLERAQEAVQETIHDRVDRMTARLQRFLELDIARIEGYYDALAQDLQTRRQRAQGDEERVRSFDEKLAALQAEREHKLHEAMTRYHLQVDIELINVLLLEVPKIFAPIVISNRTASITRYAVWNPLVHRLDPLTCDVCGKPGGRLYLCTGGHLAHESCLAPQCIDCKRVYCKLCADQILSCAVCHQPVCRASLIRCPECGRGTCRAHQGLCHANNGEPVDLTQITLELQPPAEIESKPEPEPEPKPAPPPAPSRPASSRRGSTSAARGTSRGKKRRRSPAARRDKPKVSHIHIEVDEDTPQIVAFVMRSARKELAVRHIELTDHGIEVHCLCEKQWACPVNGMVYRPWPPSMIAEQIKDLIEDLRTEYGVSPRKITYHYLSGGVIVRESQVLTLPSVWLDRERIRRAQEGYDRY